MSSEKNADNTFVRCPMKLVGVQPGNEKRFVIFTMQSSPVDKKNLESGDQKTLLMLVPCDIICFLI